MGKKRKKEGKQGKVDFNLGTNAIFIIVIVVLLIIIGFMYVSSSKERTTLDQICVGDDEKLEEKYEGKEIGYCEEKVVPDRVAFEVIKSEVDNDFRNYGFLLTTWRDGTAISIAPDKYRVSDLRCNAGDPSQNQNADYYYCNNLYYAKTLMNLDGNFKDTREYFVDLVLDRNNYEVFHNDPPEWLSGHKLRVTHDVIDYKCKEI